MDDSLLSGERQFRRLVESGHPNVGTYGRMSTPDPDSQRRYRRRILGLGAVVLVVTFAIGSAIFVPVVQNDLENRVDDELVEAGFAGVSVSFSGQDGTLTCADVLDDPDSAERLVENVHGVRVVDLDRTCRAGSDVSGVGADQTETSSVESAPVDTDAADDDAADDGAADTTTSTEAPSTDADSDSIVDVVSGDPLFSQLAGLLETAGLTGADGLGGNGPFTVLAPTDAAFDAAFDELGADAFNALLSDPEVLRTVLLHHVTNGIVTSGGLVAGDLTMLDGSAVTVGVGADGAASFTSSGTSADGVGVVAGVDDPATQLDIEATNGVVHAIDRVLIPDGVDLVAIGQQASTTASFTNGQITLSGVVQSEEQRALLVTAAQQQVDPANVIDQLVVDPDAVIDDADIARLTSLIGVMAPNLVNGQATLDGSDLSLNGTYGSDAGLATLNQVAADNGADTDLSGRAVADAGSARALQDELNDFVSLNPVLFEPNSATLTPAANAVIEQIAARAGRLDGTSITIIGHTDSDGSQATNQTLSEGRAASVLAGLVTEGLDAATLSSEGRGSTEPILDAAGVENKAASRRVEFIVEAN